MMTGPTLTVTVPPAVESTQSFPSPSSHPSPEGDSPSTTNTRSSSHTRLWSNKSLPNLPAYEVPAVSFDADDFRADLNLTFVPEPPRAREDTNEKSAGVPIRHSFGGSRPWTERMGRRKSMMLSRPQSWMPSSKSTPDLGHLPQVTVTEEATSGKEGEGSLAPDSTTQEGVKNVSDSFASFAKRSWISTSRSPSPSTRQEEVVQTPQIRPGRERAPSNSSIMKLRKGSRNRSGSSSSESSRSNESLGKIGNYLNRIKVRPQTARVKGTVPNELDSSASSTTSLVPASTDTRKSHASETSNSTFPEDVGKPSIARDPLWSVFKNLETDFQRFQAKTTALKMNLVRSSLVPFLRIYASHPSNLNLHHEDLERRAIILNKWWTGLLDMLHVQTHPPVTGVNRPTLLDAMSTIMMRPEWRQSNPTFRPLADRNPQERTRRRSQPGLNESTSSFHSTDSAYLAESTEHNVKNMFTANLVSQMAIVVEKMSLRHAPNSLVNFAGKACAYAFFFAPGVADILVRLWSLTPDSLRRMADEFGLPRRSKGESDDIVSLFPPGMDKLGWTSVKIMSDALRKPAQPPLASTKISWNGPWVTRWNGRDSDLFFIFCKYYFILAEGFMPPNLPLVEKARAPGFVLVNAQTLSVLDSTIHRQAAVQAMSAPLSDAIHGADASAMALQMAPSNSNILKGMTDNRLIALLKDLLSDASISFGSARYTFAESFMAVMKAAAKHTSQFDHSACFTICDFLEESLVAYKNFDDVADPELVDVDWPFWFEVCKKILESNNSMSEIRVLSLIFSIWETIASSQGRKESICLDWLLTEETFDKLFNNWCPMVRAYYMRLLCWRICRDAGSANESDTRIFLLVFTRLKTVWSHYLWLKQHAEQEGKFPPSTAPSFPTPGKRFMIIRTETPTLQPAFIAGFDSLPTSPRQDMMGAPATDFDSINTFNPEVSRTAKKTWSLLGKVFSFTANTAVSNDLETLRRDTAASRANAALSPKMSNAIISPTASDTDSIGSSPTYEATQYHFKFMLSWNNAGTMPPPNRVLTRPRLPSPAQSWVTARGHGGGLPPIAGPPAPTRAVSGSPFPGLVDSARNAGTSDVPTSPSSVSTALDRRSSLGQLSSTDLNEDDIPLHRATGLTKENLVNPVQPTGSFARSVKYAGRALAEWSLVVSECNSFVERRRDEGVLGLQDVEVPALGVEGFRKIC
ncbi:DUF1765-domain-containing protein [Xylariaceae sp. AK1471]|nr:DUF1765-domain-containing protein [Xylariaceae sp. AK1471]